MMKPIDPTEKSRPLTIEPKDRLHRLVARLLDTHIDDLTDDAIDRIERQVDDLRLTHADGTKFGSKAHG
ncbi:hypothetical protein [Sinorhizobium americanum]|uniref:Uncharacterized protein n=1 Tax=Sinorhizobium americanum TaxID=194963 RepID=A0A4R2BTZ7_9HYPH|nr:hypothetical protein [Sinorhizobium americanum]TCN30293.1 hypothetical protein EV184_108167 [Sinorhizobium americanum]